MVESIKLITVQEDFTELESYKVLDKQTKDYVWTYAKAELNDIMMYDYYECLECCVEAALERNNLDQKEILYDKGEL